MKFDLEEQARVKLHRDVLRISDLIDGKVTVQFVSDKGEGETVIDLGTYLVSDFKRVGKAI
jgi:hypothetical protein